ncbi:BTG family protein [Ancylostoma duodenale]|uniref:BTG family protein n=1 Tax=Ancylostoma duodenale TaxID=51022 RepID=A0A0C2HDS8_9BILA|nr:BTG family protein [Ancylostoma duodenale]
MYTEVKELVNFLAKYLIGRIPRRPASLFTCQLANFLICRFREHKWDLNEPSKGHDEQHRVVRSKVNGFTDQLIISAATEMGLSSDEVLECLPDNILLFANPGEVFYRAGENAAAVPIWTGEKGIDPDLSYCSLPAFVTNPACAATTSPISNMGAAGKPFYVGRSRKTDAAFEIDDAYVQLKLEPVHSSNADDNVLLPQSNLMMFSYTPKNHVSYTIKEFSATRFGSHRQRPDHDVMKRIQRQAANRGVELAAHPVPGSNNSKMRSCLLEAGDSPEVKNAVSSRAAFPKSPPNHGDTTMTDIETLKTLTPEQREALVNLIRNSSLYEKLPLFAYGVCILVDHSLTHLQQALVGPQIAATTASINHNCTPPQPNALLRGGRAPGRVATPDSQVLQRVVRQIQTLENWRFHTMERMR